ncbi:uncharacterized protein LACBIDRAFT_328007 [Laccaria bicolor S238N-H82]|uniref:Predicted protein n=1 Tax=Laccaria bicolor (strain S238N-H82 / ATCC MYA-4686) TaxID=486041 RepID=B0DDJ1_LACBS|nr:uncharacterized protein LACBIDRAFT_328007 [Laccaria bicolor S238N-H82]EDR07621.1 predicted protein [Laccaria bicolor S238N-H82]|eukprot:XP_001882013.1 predicted protein [Laccaria bicolor S238N-H82]
MPPELHQAIQTPLNSSNRKDTRIGLEQFVVDAEREIIRLRQTIFAAKTSINECTSIWTLPPELITEIFILACHPEYDATREGLGEQEMWPLRLGAVCKAWRDLAWSSSQLWSSIVFVSRRDTLTFDLQDILGSWISRCKSRPLSIHIDAPNLDICCGHVFYTSTFIGTASRWKNVSLRLPQGFLCYFVNLVSCFPILEQLSLITPDLVSGREWNFGESLNILRSSTMPQIKRLYLPQYVKSFDIWPSALRSLTTLSMDYIYDDQAYHILNFTSNSLQEFVAQHLMADNMDRRENRPLILPILRRLVLKRALDYNFAGLNKLLLKIITPSIKELTIELCNDHTLIPSLPDFMSDFSRSLQRLHITCLGLNSLADCRWLISCILKVDSLLELHFTGDEQSREALVDCLGPAAPKESSGDHLPLLETFTITVDMGVLPIEGLQKMLVYRFSGVSTTCVRLKTVRIETCGCFWEDINVLRTALADSKSEITFATLKDQYCDCASSDDKPE